MLLLGQLTRSLLLVTAVLLLLGAAPADSMAVVTALVRIGLANAQSNFSALRSTYHSDVDVNYYDTHHTSPRSVLSIYDIARFEQCSNNSARADPRCAIDPWELCANGRGFKIRHEQTRVPFRADNWQIFCSSSTVDEPLEAGAETLRRAVAAVVPPGFAYERRIYATPTWIQMIWTGPEGVRVLLEIESDRADQARFDVVVIHDLLPRM